MLTLLEVTYYITQELSAYEIPGGRVHRSLWEISVREQSQAAVVLEAAPGGCSFILEDEAVAATFCIYTVQSFVHTCTWIRESLCHASGLHPGKVLPFPWARGIKILNMAMFMLTMHMLTQDFIDFPKKWAF